MAPRIPVLKGVQGLGQSTRCLLPPRQALQERGLYPLQAAWGPLPWGWSAGCPFRDRDARQVLKAACSPCFSTSPAPRHGCDCTFPAASSVCITSSSAPSLPQGSQPPVLLWQVISSLGKRAMSREQGRVACKLPAERRRRLVGRLAASQQIRLQKQSVPAPCREAAALRQAPRLLERLSHASLDRSRHGRCSLEAHSTPTLPALHGTPAASGQWHGQGTSRSRVRARRCCQLSRPGTSLRAGR